MGVREDYTNIGCSFPAEEANIINLISYDDVAHDDGDAYIFDVENGECNGEICSFIFFWQF